MKERARTIINTLLQKTGIDSSDVLIEEFAGQTIFQIKTPESRLLIGTQGETLRAFEYIVKKILEKDTTEISQFTIDVDGYKSKQIKNLQQKAIIMAERARSFQYDVELTPMSSYERLIIHATLTNAPQVKTESRGEGRERRVVIRYIPTKDNAILYTISN